MGLESLCTGKNGPRCQKKFKTSDLMKRPQRRFMDVEKDDMRMVGVSEEDGEDFVRWGRLR